MISVLYVTLMVTQLGNIEKIIKSSEIDNIIWHSNMLAL